MVIQASGVVGKENMRIERLTQAETLPEIPAKDFRRGKGRSIQSKESLMHETLRRSL